LYEFVHEWVPKNKQRLQQMITAGELSPHVEAVSVCVRTHTHTCADAASTYACCARPKCVCERSSASTVHDTLPSVSAVCIRANVCAGRVHTGRRTTSSAEHRRLCQSGRRFRITRRWARVRTPVCEGVGVQQAYRVTCQLRKLTDRHKNKQDKLQLCNIIWSAQTEAVRCIESGDTC
jgi:hypothetical protein